MIQYVSGDNRFDPLLDPSAPIQMTRRDVPDVVFPSDNDYGIPLLDGRKQADLPDLPITVWGGVKRGTYAGTYTFYCDDYRFEALWSDPNLLINSGCRNIVEPNYTTSDNMPRAVVLNLIYKKRWIARLCQHFGIRVFVDLNVSAAHLEDNLLGVPVGWRAWATRGYSERLEDTQREYEAACARAGTEDILFVVYGGGKRVQEACANRHWWHVPERADVAKMMAKGKPTIG